MAMFVFAI